MSMAGDVSWQLSATRATLSCGPLRATFDALLPAKGIAGATYDGVPLAGLQFLGLDIAVGDPAFLTEFYQRGRDLIVRYAQTSERVFAVTAYWRAGLLDIGGSLHPHVDLIVSVETSLLDSRPLLSTKSILHTVGEKRLRIQAGRVLCQFDEPAVTYCEMCHPEDLISPSAATTDRTVEVTTLLFGLPLEKGVILRSRLRGLFAPHQDDEQVVQAALAEFAAEAPPLTT
jgi:hypothetical protein